MPAPALLLRKYIPAIACLYLLPATAAAEWNVVSQRDAETQRETLVAQTRNAEGHTLAIYRDAGGAIRSRFGLNDSLNGLAEKSCPTYQIDNRDPRNVSINDAACISHRLWAEYVLGYIQEKRVVSLLLHELMNGNKIVYRFKLLSGGYDETEFSLAGSKRALLAVLGSDLEIRAR